MDLHEMWTLTIRSSCSIITRRRIVNAPSNVKLLFLFSAILFVAPLSGATAIAQDKVQVFEHIVRPAGWEFPKGSTAAKRDGGTESLPGSKIVRFRSLPVSGTFFFPAFFAKDGVLTLFNQEVSTTRLDELSAAGKIFGYTAIVFGVDTASAHRVWWIDLEGDGRFSDFSTLPFFPGLPSWLNAYRGKRGSFDDHVRP